MAEINVTPLVDVMLVLLIIFMVTAPLLATGVQVDLPESKAAPLEQDNEPVPISIDATGAIFIDDTPVPDECWHPPGQDRSPRRRKAAAIFLGRRGLHYGRVLEWWGR